MERRFLRPEEKCPAPLNEDFWRGLVGVRQAETRTETRSTSVPSEVARAAAVTAEVEKTIRENKENIIDIVMKQVCIFVFSQMGFALDVLGF